MSSLFRSFITLVHSLQNHLDTTRGVACHSTGDRIQIGFGGVSAESARRHTARWCCVGDIWNLLSVRTARCRRQRSLCVQVAGRQPHRSEPPLTRTRSYQRPTGCGRSVNCENSRLQSRAFTKECTGTITAWIPTRAHAKPVPIAQQPTRLSQWAQLQSLSTSSVHMHASRHRIRKASIHSSVLRSAIVCIRARIWARTRTRNPRARRRWPHMYSICTCCTGGSEQWSALCPPCEHRRSRFPLDAHVHSRAACIPSQPAAPTNATCTSIWTPTRHPRVSSRSK